MSKTVIETAAVKLALEALEKMARLTSPLWALENNYAGHLEAIIALREALAEQPEPVPWSQALESVWAEHHDPIGDEQDKLIAEQAAQPAPVGEAVGIVKDLFTNAAWDKLDVVGSTKVYLDFPPAQRTWVGLMRGVRVEGDTVVITVKGGNDAARELCGALLEEKNT